jgi:hypothetical protein
MNKISWGLLICFLICFSMLITKEINIKEKQEAVSTDVIITSTKTIEVKFAEGTEAYVTGCFKSNEENDIREYFSTIEPKDIDESKYELKSVVFKYKKIK